MAERGGVKTPEEIAEAKIAEAETKGRSISAMNRAVLDAAREAQREWQAHEYEWRNEATRNAARQWQSMHDAYDQIREHFGLDDDDERFPKYAPDVPIRYPDPQFAPEGEPDEYRDHFNAINDWTPEGGHVPVQIINRRVAMASLDQARHILAYLSEQNRKDN